LPGLTPHASRTGFYRNLRLASMDNLNGHFGNPVPLLFKSQEVFPGQYSTSYKPQATSYKLHKFEFSGSANQVYPAPPPPEANFGFGTYLGRRVGGWAKERRLGSGAVGHLRSPRGSAALPGCPPRNPHCHWKPRCCLYPELRGLARCPLPRRCWQLLQESSSRSEAPSLPLAIEEAFTPTMSSFLSTTPVDRRFPNTNQAPHCWCVNKNRPSMRALPFSKTVN
jgi:hypothetical protein